MALYGTGEDDRGNGWFIGEPLTVWYGYEQIGIWQTTEATVYDQIPGDIKVRDVNGDGAINQEDLLILGTDIPDLTMGLTSRLRVKNIDFSFFLFGSFGQTIENEFRVNNSTLQTRYNLTSPFRSATNLRNSPVAIFGPFFSGAMDGEIYRIG